MTELRNFPFVNQRTDGDVNHDFDCVPSSLAAGANYLLGKSVVNDAAMKDAVYGAGYIGGTAASAYTDYLRVRGIHIYPINGSYPFLLQQAHQHLAAGHPVVFTRDDPYAPGHPDWSHVSVWYKDTPNSLTAMDPFGAYAITMSDSEWIAHLRFNELWIVEKMVTTTIPAGWHDDGHTLTAPNGVGVVLGFRDYILHNTWDPTDVPLQPEYQVDQVLIHNMHVGPGSRLLCRKSFLWYTNAMGVQRESFIAWELDASYVFIGQLQQEILTLKASLAPIPQPTPQPSINTTDLAAQLQTIATAAAAGLKDLQV